MSGNVFSFNNAGVSSEDILKYTEKGIDQPDMVEPKEEEDEILKKEKDKSPTKMDDLPLTWRSFKDHPNDNIISDITL